MTLDKLVFRLGGSSDLFETTANDCVGDLADNEDGLVVDALNDLTRKSSERSY
jgi:hypothetical protein